MRWVCFTLLVWGISLGLASLALAGFSSEESPGERIEPSNPLMAMLFKAAEDLKAVNPQAGQGIEEIAVAQRINKVPAPQGNTAAGMTLADGEAGTRGDRVNISEGFLNNPHLNPTDPSTWTGSCWNQLLGVLAHEWVHANGTGPMPTDQDQSALTDYLWEKPAYEKELQVLAALGEPDGFYFVTVYISGQPIALPVKTRRQYLKQQLEEKRRKANAQLRSMLGGVLQSAVQTGRPRALFGDVVGESGNPTRIHWAVDGAVLYGMTPTQDGGYRFELPLDEVSDVHIAPNLPLGSDRAVAFVSGRRGDSGALLGVALSGDEVAGVLLDIALPGGLPESIVFGPSSSTLWVLEAAGQAIYAIRDTDGDGVPDSLTPTPYATAADFPLLSGMHHLGLYVGRSGVAVTASGYLPSDVVPHRGNITFLVDQDGDGLADASEPGGFAEFVRFAPTIVDEPQAGAMVCRAHGVAGAQISLLGCDESGVFSGETLAVATVGEDNAADFILVRPLRADEFLRLHDPANDPDSESAVYRVPPAGTNRRPLLSFTDFQLLPAVGPSGVAVTLDASPSSDPDGDSLSFTWERVLDSYTHVDPLGTAATTTTTLPVGAHVIRLVVSDGASEVWAYANVAVTPPSPSFTDVPSCGAGSDGLDPFWAFWGVEACVEVGIVEGFDDGTYRPILAVTRDQMAVYIARALAGGEAHVPTGPGTVTFTDVPLDFWAFDHIQYAVDQGVVGGYGDGTYRPGNPVDRGQMAVFVARALVAPTGEAGLADYVPADPRGFSDVPADYWAFKHVEYCAENGVVGGYDDGTYRPGDQVTRDQMAVYVARAFRYPM